LLEKLFVQKLDSFIEKNSSLSESQYGFWSNMSTALAIMKVIEEITTARDRKKFAIGVFIDLKKSFDSIDHSILLSNRAGHIFALTNEFIIADNYLSPINAVFIVYYFYCKRLLLTGFYFDKVLREQAYYVW